MWYPPKACFSGAIGFAGCCLKNFCGLAYQSKVSLPACYSYIEDVLLDCLTIGSAFSACVRKIFACLCAVELVCPAIPRWLDAKYNNEYKLVASLVPLSVSKHSCSAPNRYSIPHLLADNVLSTGTSGKTPSNQPSSSGSRCCPSE
ncbi:hypothetical protein DSO57_1006105 [Entomophthora muscae]|uniref:Uncharacterized protein n=1 Tax=Entomophthora muscae TaxID=34485 RepID=A0ACC2TIA9_9FUNG|nr:hypothetical protein DSO57_1006105 [Entomophthora muscae]